VTARADRRERLEAHLAFAGSICQGWRVAPHPSPWELVVVRVGSASIVLCRRCCGRRGAEVRAHKALEGRDP
jgi:hypothetical protein